MKFFYIVLSVLLFCLGTKAQILNIPQPLKGYLVGSPSFLYIEGSYTYPFTTTHVIDTNGNGEIEVSEAALVEYLDIHASCNLNSLAGLEQFVNLKQLKIQAHITTFNSVDFPNLKSLLFDYTHITSLDLSGLTNLEEFSSHLSNTLQAINFNGLTTLKKINLDDNYVLGSIGLTGLSNLNSLKTYRSAASLSIDFSQIPNLKKLTLVYFGFATMDLTPLTVLENLEIDNSLITNLIHSGLPNLKTLVFYDNNHIAVLDLHEMPSIENIRCNDNSLLTTLLWDVNAYPSLRDLECTGNAITSVTMNGFPSLVNMNYGGNQISSIQLHGFPVLQYFSCNSNLLSVLDVTQCPNLQTLACASNQINNLNVVGMTELSYVYCSNNQLTSFNSPLPHLYHLDCSYNQLSTLDLQASRGLNTIYCHYNQLTSLYLKNNVIEQSVAFFQNPNLTYICVDSEQINTIQNQVTGLGYTGCTVVDDCFVLANVDFEFSDAVVLYPNPATNELNIQTDDGLELSKLSVYTILGQQVLSVSDKGISSLDVSELKSGTYFISVETDKGTITKRFIKE